MNCCDPLALTAAINSLAVMLSNCMSEEELEMTAVLLTQLGDTLTTISMQRSLCGKKDEQIE
jgi:hypothetical protein